MVVVLNRFIKSLITLVLSLVIFSCFQVDEYKDSYFSDSKDLSEREDSYSYLSRDLIKDKSSINYTFSSLTGTETIFKIDLDTPTSISITYIKSITKGKLKCFVIAPDGSSFNLTPGINLYNALTKGTYFIKVVSYDSSGKLALRYNL